MISKIRRYVMKHQDYSILSWSTRMKLFQGINFFKEYYSSHDETHDIYHVIDVTIRALCMNAILKLGLKKENIIIAGLAHDMFSTSNRAEHHVYGCRWISIKKELPLFGYSPFERSDRHAVANAILEHRASYRGEYTTLLSELISAADRDKPDLNTLLHRVYKCAKDKSNVFEIDKGKEIPSIDIACGNLVDVAKEIYKIYPLSIYKSYVHIIEKYHEKGYARRNRIYDMYYGKLQEVFFNQIHNLTVESLVMQLVRLERNEYEKHLDTAGELAELKLLCGWERS